MPFRDDHEAALARVDALEQELRREQSDDAEREQRVAELEKELGEARAKLERAEKVLAEVRGPEPEPAPSMGSALRPPDLDAPLVDPARSARRPQAEQDPALPEPEGSPAIPMLVIGGVILVVVLLGMTLGGRKHEDRSPPRPPPPPPVRATPDEIAGYLTDARTRAETKLPGGALVAIEAEGVASSGTLDLTFGRVRFEFERIDPPETYEPGPDTPIGAPHPEPSRFRTLHCFDPTYQARGVYDEGVPDLCIDVETTGRREISPDCTMRAIWDMALADGAPKNAIAKISFDGSWHFVIDDPRASFARTYADHCAPGTAERPQR